MSYFHNANLVLQPSKYKSNIHPMLAQYIHLFYNMLQYDIYGLVQDCSIPSALAFTLTDRYGITYYMIHRWQC